MKLFILGLIGLVYLGGATIHKHAAGHNQILCCNQGELHATR